MTLVKTPSPGAPSAPGEGKPLPRWARNIRLEPTPPPKPASPVRQVFGSTVTILAITLLGFASWLAFFSRLPYDRAQHDIYANSRITLAQGLGPTGPTQPTAKRKLLVPGTAVAVMTIPAIGLRVVVLEGTSGTVLESGPGHLRDTEMPGQLGICELMGRRATYGAPFARIASLPPGSDIFFITGQGKSRYRVMEVRRPHDPNPPLYPGQGRLILATADGPPFAPTDVVRVDARLISKPFATPPMVISGAQIAPDEYPLGTDSLAWIPLFLWGQALVVAAGALSWLRARWGRWQTWIVAIPTVGFLGVTVAEQITRLLPNLL